MRKIDLNLSFKNGDLQKSDTLILFILFSFFCLIIYFDPRLLSLLVGKEPLVAKVGVVIFVITLNMMWLYGVYHFSHIIFSLLSKNKFKSLPDFNEDCSPYVAILYTTINDFNEEACLTCVNQDYKNFKVFICDDSTDINYRNRIDDFARKHNEKTEIIRRTTKNGFKAGNINNALKIIDEKYKYVAVMDADTRLPSNYLKRIIPYFKLSPKIAFVQAVQESLKSQNKGFASILKPIIDIHWKYYMKLKNLYGFVMWYGHGAVLKRDVIKKVGGIPEVITEDLAFSSEARRKGYYGIVADDVKTGEELPDTIEKYRKRNRKWVRGTYQYLLKFYPKILFSKNVFWFEKVDILVSAFSLLQAFPFLLLVYSASFIMPEYYALRELQGPFFLVPPPIYDNYLQVILKTRYNVFWIMDFYLIMFVTIFFPLFPALVEFRRNKKRMLQYMGMSAFIHLSLILDSAKEIVLYTFTHKTYFNATNNIYAMDRSRIFLIAEFAMGLFLMWYSFLTYNLWLAALGFAFVLISITSVIGYRKWVNIFIQMPFALTSAIMFFIGITILQNMV